MATLFTKRYSRPNANNKEYVRTAKGGWSTCVQGQPTDSVCDTLANCVGYACGRFNEIYNELTGNVGMKYPSLNCNAENFIERAKQYYPELQFSDKPVPGAIICWAKGKPGVSSDGAGHVAIVEDVIDNNTIKTSESAYGGSAFYVSTRKNDNGRWGLGSAYSFRAFILNPSVKLVDSVSRETTVDQIQVNTNVLRMRRTPDDTTSNNIWGSYCPVGYFNVLATAKVIDKEWGDTWYKIEENVWVAGVSDVIYLKKSKTELEDLRKENELLKQKIAKAIKDLQ